MVVENELSSFEKVLSYEFEPRQMFVSPLTEAATGGVLHKKILKNFAKFIVKYLCQPTFYCYQKGGTGVFV